MDIEDESETHRSNSLHYYLIDEDEIMHTSDVYIYGELLVFGGNMFRKED